MPAGKLVDFFGCLPGHVIQQTDAELAYVQADLQGPETWIAPPPEVWPPEWQKRGYKTPAVRL
eukprot:11208924-Lingulodinium_polyedra.AAC.1